MQNKHALLLPELLPFDTEILAGQIRDSSKQMYARDIADYLAFARAQRLDPLESATFARWRHDLSTRAAHYSPNTINRMLSAVKRLMAEAAQQGKLSNERALAFKALPGVKVRALKERLRPNSKTYIPPEKLRQMAEAATLAGTLKGTRDAALLHTLASSAIRLSEAASLTLENLQRTEQDGKVSYSVLVCGKTDEEPRQAPLTAEAYQAIQRWIEARPVASQFVFTAADGRGGRWTARPIAGRNIEEMVSAYATQVGLKHVKPHDFRRFVATQLARRNLRTAQKVLGHKHIATTARYDLGEVEPGVTEGLY
jgi:site-specific recombinase XerD